MLLFYQISAWVFLIHMFLYAGFYCILNLGQQSSPTRGNKGTSVYPLTAKRKITVGRFLDIFPKSKSDIAFAFFYYDYNEDSFIRKIALQIERQIPLNISH